MLKLNKADATVKIEHIKKDLHIIYGKRTHLSLDLTDVLYLYFDSIRERRPKTGIKKTFEQGGVDLEVKVIVDEGEEMFMEKKNLDHKNE